MRVSLASAAALAILGVAALSGCGSSGSTGGNSAASKASVLIALDVPSSADPYVAGFITRGAQLAVREANAKGLVISGQTYQVALKTYDDAGQPQQSAANVDSAIQDGAVAVIEDGIGSAISAPRSDAAGVPEIVIDNGDATLLDPAQRPALFRLGIANDAAAGVMSTYIAAKTKRVDIIHDDTAGGRDGAEQMRSGLATAGASVAASIEIPVNAASVDAQVAQLVGTHAGAIVIWGADAFTGKLIAAVRGAGITTPLFTGPEGESPAVRAIAGNSATDGVRLVESRMTSEDDASSFGQFEHRLAAAGLGPTDASVKNAAGEEIRQPNDRDLFAYDAVNLVLAALKKQGSVRPGQALVKALSGVTVQSANGDTRGFDPQTHEGVSDDDMYIAVIHDMQFEPVKDEQLSASLPAQDEILAHFH